MNETTSPETSGDQLTVNETVALFDAAGVPRSDWSVKNWCRTGKLLCSQIESEANGQPAYLIDRASVETKIEEIKQALRSGKLVGSRTIQVVSEEPRSTTESSDDLQSTPEVNRDSHEGANDLKDQIESLRAEKLNLMAEKKGLEVANEHIVKSSMGLVEKLDARAVEVGRLSAEKDLLLHENRRLKAIAAPIDSSHEGQKTPGDEDHVSGEDSDSEEAHSLFSVEPNSPQDIPSGNSGNQDVGSRMESDEHEQQPLH